MTPEPPQLIQVTEKENKPLAPMWLFKLVNPFIKALLVSRLHGILSSVLMLLTYQGRKTGIWYTNPVGYFNWDQDEVMTFTSGRWWTNLTDGRHVTLLIQGQRFEAVPNVIHEREELIQTVGEFYTRLGLKKARMLPLGLPTDRQPTPEELQSIPTGIALVRFHIIGPS